MVCDDTGAPADTRWNAGEIGVRNGLGTGSRRGRRPLWRERN